MQSKETDQKFSPPPDPERPVEIQSWQKNGNWSQIVSAAAACLSLVLTLVGLVLVLIQLQTLKLNSDTLQNTAVITQRNAAEAAARQVYMSYSEAALKYPRLAAAVGVMPGRNNTEYLRYRFFVAHMLFAYDEMLSVFPNSPEWQASFESDLVLHNKFLCSEPSDWFDQFYERIRSRIKQIKADCQPTKKPLNKRSAGQARAS